MKSTIIMLSLVSALGLSSCGITSLLEAGGGSATERIERGMSREQVQSLLGRPYARSIGYNGEEIWTYRRESLFEEVRTIQITFYDGRVVKMDSYRGDTSRRGESYPSYPDNYPSYPSRRGDYPIYGESSRYRLSEEAFQRIVYGVQRQSFKDDKLRYLRDAAQRNRFTVSQTERLLRLFSWDEEKLQVLQYVAPGLLDPQDAYRLVDFFTFESGKRKARRILGYR